MNTLNTPDPTYTQRSVLKDKQRQSTDPVVVKFKLCVRGSRFHRSHKRNRETQGRNFQTKLLNKNLTVEKLRRFLQKFPLK